MRRHFIAISNNSKGVVSLPGFPALLAYSEFSRVGAIARTANPLQIGEDCSPIAVTCISADDTSAPCGGLQSTASQEARSATASCANPADRHMRNNLQSAAHPEMSLFGPFCKTCEAVALGTRCGSWTIRIALTLTPRQSCESGRPSKASALPPPRVRVPT
jgi:hypothetical protein